MLNRSEKKDTPKPEIEKVTCVFIEMSHWHRYELDWVRINDDLIIEHVDTLGNYQHAVIELVPYMGMVKIELGNTIIEVNNYRSCSPVDIRYYSANQIRTKLKPLVVK